MSEIKKSWIVCAMDGFPVTDDAGKVREFNSEKAAVKVAKEHVNGTEESEAWIFQLSHVVERPDVEPTVTKLK